MSKGLQAIGMHKRFGGVHALDDAAISVEPGRVIGLIGRNGSGKTTLFNCITGFIVPDSGSVTVDGRDITGAGPQTIVKAGLSRTFQTPREDARSTVRDAVLCGCYVQSSASFLGALTGLPGARREERRIGLRADALLERFGLAAQAEAPVGTLSMGLVRLVEVARAIASGARYLLLDEPAAGLSAAEQDILSAQIRALASSGVGVLLVEHNFSLVLSMCDRITVLEFGKVLSEGAPEQVARDPGVIEAYLGAVERGDTGSTQ